MTALKYWLGPVRIPFLILTPACVLLGLATASWTTNQINWSFFNLALAGAVSAHISVNLFNEYYDFKSGLDAKTIKTPFSGGSGILPKNPDMAPAVLILAWISFVLTASIGVFFIIAIGPALIPLGLLGLIIILTYTNWITHYPLLCLIAPGLGFGPLMVMGTDFVLTGQYSWTAFFASLVPFFLANNLLLLNQFPDVAADGSIGRKDFPITIGKQNSSYIFTAFLILPYLILIIGVYAGFLPPSSLIGLITFVLVIPLIQGVIKHSQDTEKLIPYMAQNVIINILTPLLLATGIFIS